MILVAHCCGDTRRQWARAMQIEFEVAVAEGEPLQFAAGCMIAALRDLPIHRAGRIALANYALALALLVPMAGIQLFYAVGGQQPARSDNPYLCGAQMAAVPSLMAIWLLLGVAHLRLAWGLLDRDWPRVASMSAMTVAGVATLAIYMSVLAFDDAKLGLNVAAMAAELAMLFAALRCQGVSPRDHERPRRPAGRSFGTVSGSLAQAAGKQGSQRHFRACATGWY